MCENGKSLQLIDVDFINPALHILAYFSAVAEAELARIPHSAAPHDFPLSRTP